VIETAAPASRDTILEAGPCQSCGACCAYSRAWPRFTTEDDADLGRIPPVYVADDLRGMRCDGDRCTALIGEIGISTACVIYDDRPDVCRACEAGDEACAMARQRHGLAPLPAP
jgi:Fe-S-cluster containining protein